MLIHTFGDSHSYSGWGGIPNLRIHHLGPKLCYSFGRDGLNIKEEYGVNDGDVVIFCFGEIDCRCHIHKYITDGDNYKQIIDAIVDKYFICISEAVQPFSNIKTCVYNVVPPIEKSNTEESPEYPFLGTDEQRKTYVQYFNQKIKEKATEYCYIFFDVYDKYTDTNGFLNKSLSDGNVHILDGKYIRDFVKENLL